MCTNPFETKQEMDGSCGKETSWKFGETLMVLKTTK